MSSPSPAAASVINVANAVTLLRLALIPVFVTFVVISEMTDPAWRIAAAVAFGVASLTDFIDGWLARWLDQVTSFGKVADPIADKALIGAALVLLSAYQALPWWVTVVILVREIGVTLVRFWVIRYGVIAASRGGKAKTVLQIAAIVWYLLPWPAPLDLLGLWIMGLAVVVTVVTGVDYAFRALALRRSAGPEPGGR
ncbi:MAG TPA: CDP-diacylglycerol--glycerol-3-phosphate 3-phosphatidyltransferase [Micromonosporaceae bacterium]|nr:CDP-diacylglycerol--glycerol-3-phosphate 3-phosphatidyltransferase [Micromonosporaceae bacterium]